MRHVSAEGGMASEGVKLLGMWASPFALRVKWALKLKGIEYEYIEEDLENKSPLLLQYNPVYKKVPVLVHNQKAIAESLVIIEYIDETWRHNPILPEDPYQRAMARFWARFAEDKCLPATFNVFSKQGEQQEIALKEARDCLKTLEKGLKGKFFGGESIGFVDISAGWLPYWICMIEEIAGVTMIDEESMPLLSAWFNDFLGLDMVKELLPPKDKLLDLTRGYRERVLAAST